MNNLWVQRLYFNQVNMKENTQQFLICREQKGELAGSFGLLHIFSIFPSMQLVKRLSRQKRNSVAELLLVSFFWNTLRSTVAVSLSNCWANKVCNNKSFESNTLSTEIQEPITIHNEYLLTFQLHCTMVVFAIFFYFLLVWLCFSTIC